MPGKAVLEALSHVWRVLEPLNRATAVMGGLAVAVWQQVRATQDVDLLIDVGDENINDLLQKLAAANIRPKREPPLLTIGGQRILQCLYEPPESFVDVQIDLLFADAEFHRTALRRRKVIRLPGTNLDVSVVSCEDMIIFKLLAGRILDRVDSASLLRANRANLEIGYLTGWADKLKLRSELVEIWAEAFPGDTLP
jgi:hypothetical protein